MSRRECVLERGIAMRCLAAFLGSLVLVAGAAARAETCSKTGGTLAWTAITDNVNSGGGAAWTGSPCTPGSGDTFEIDEGEVNITGTLAAGAGVTEIVCKSGGTLRIAAGALIDWSGGAAGSRLRIEPGCNFHARGAVLAECRLAADPAHEKGASSLTTVALSGCGAPNAHVAAGDFLVYGNDDPPSGRITRRAQTAGGVPLANRYRPSYEAGRWYQIESVTETSLRYYADLWTDVAGAGGPGGPHTRVAGTAPYSGTRGPALVTPTALRSNTRSKGGTLSLLTLDIPAVSIDGDLTDQYVVWRSGGCAGKRDAIQWSETATIDPAVPDANLETLYVAGDTTACGATPQITIEPGGREGDKVYLVRPFRIDGGGVAHVEIRGGTNEIEWGRFYRLGAYEQTKPVASISGCNVCFLPHASGAPPPTGSMRNVDIAVPYGRSEVGALGFPNSNGATQFLYEGEPFDMSGMPIANVYIHDQYVTSAGVAGGVHGINAFGTTGLDVSGIFVERLVDDGIMISLASFGDNLPMTARITRSRVNATLTHATNTSAQCMELLSADAGAGSSDALHGSFHVSDTQLRGCDEAALGNAVLNSTFERMVVGSSRGSGVWVGRVEHFTALPDNAVELYPNTYRDLVVFQLTGQSSATSLSFSGGSIHDSILAGNVVGGGNGSNLRGPCSIANTLVDLGRETTSYFHERYGTGRHAACSTLRVSHSVLSNALAFAASASGFNDTEAPVLTWLVDHAVFAANTLDGAGFFRNGETGTDAITAIADHLILNTMTPGPSGAGAANPASRYRHSCVETTLANPPTDTSNFGAARDATAVEVAVAEPDANDDVPLRAWLEAGGPGCEAPKALGLRSVGVGHAVGDAFFDSLETAFSTRALFAAACSNGEDDDGDGLVDYPDDPGCPLSHASPEDPGCDDGADNDGDGAVDFADPECQPFWPYWEQAPCGLGVELALAMPGLARLRARARARRRERGLAAHGGDGLTDYPDDPGCPSPEAAPENPACDDGAVDFAHPQRQASWPYWEKSPACGFGVELALAMPGLAWLRARLRRRRG